MDQQRYLEQATGQNDLPANDTELAGLCEQPCCPNAHEHTCHFCEFEFCGEHSHAVNIGSVPSIGRVRVCAGCALKIDMSEADKLKVQEFLQIHHHQTFGMDYLSRYLGVPYLDVEIHCEALIAKGCAKRPAMTEYVEGVPVDWAAVHAGRTEWPKWSEWM